VLSTWWVILSLLGPRVRRFLQNWSSHRESTVQNSRLYKRKCLLWLSQGSDTHDVVYMDELRGALVHPDSFSRASVILGLHSRLTLAPSVSLCW